MYQPFIGCACDDDDMANEVELFPPPLLDDPAAIEVDVDIVADDDDDNVEDDVLLGWLAADVAV